MAAPTLISSVPASCTRHSATISTENAEEPHFDPTALIPPGIVLESVDETGTAVVLTVRSSAVVGTCPVCHDISHRVHSRYTRSLADLALSGRPVRLRLLVRRFRCDRALCSRRIFSERLVSATPWARRTARLDEIVHHLGLALGGRPAASFAQRLRPPVSNNTLLRVVRRRGSPAFVPPQAVGIDNWAWKRNHRYGTLICDLEQCRTIALLPDREPATAQAWLSGQPQIEVVTRDRGGAYALAATRALPGAVQVADRWHLMENASQAFLAATRASMRQIRAAVGAATVDPRLLTAAEKLQYEGYLQREDANAAVLALHQAGKPIKEIVRRTGHSRGTVRRVLRGQRAEVSRTRESSLDGADRLQPAVPLVRRPGDGCAGVGRDQLQQEPRPPAGRRRGAEACSPPSSPSRGSGHSCQTSTSPSTAR